MTPCTGIHNTRPLRPCALMAFAAAMAAALSGPAHAGAFDVGRREEIRIGREAAALFERQFRVSRDAALQARLERIGRRLVRVADRPDLPYEFHVVEADDINALAFPGGFVYAFAGLLEALPSDDALAFVLGHEIAHAAKRHWARRYEKARKLSYLTLGYGDILQIFLQPHYSRRYESEADRYGVVWCARAGFAPEGAVQAMHTLKELSRSIGVLPIFRSHPMTAKRIKRLRQHIATIESETPTEEEQPATAVAPRPLPPVRASDDTGLSDYEVAPNARFPLRVGARWVYR
ncbi:MAG: M48 family metallopeptidase, partial [Armatimonadota bacterium]